MRRAARTKGPKRSLAPVVHITVICLITYIGLFAMLLSGITPEQYDIKVGTPAPTQIKATKDIQDTVTTEALRDAAAAAVEPSYKSVDPNVVEVVKRDLNTLFTQMHAIRDSYSTEDARKLTEEQVAKVNNITSLNLTRDHLVTLTETSTETYDSIVADAITAACEALDSTLPEGQEAAAIKSIRNELSQRYSAQLTGIIVDALRTKLQPNMLIDETITEANRQNAREDVQTVWYVKDQVIVGEGEIVTQAQYTMIASLGILDENDVDGWLILGIASVIALVMLSIGFFLHLSDREMLLRPKQITLLCLIILLVVGLSLVFRMVHSYLMPVSLGLLLVVSLMDRNLYFQPVQSSHRVLYCEPLASR